jgi:hypothetical protein
VLTLTSCGQADSVSASNTDRTSSTTQTTVAARPDRWLVESDPSAESPDEDGREIEVDEAARAFGSRVDSLFGEDLTLENVVAQEVLVSGDAPYTLYLAQYRGPSGGVNVSWRQLEQPVAILPDDVLAEKYGVTYEQTDGGELAVLPALSDGGTPSALAVSPTGFMVRVWLTMQTNTEAVGTTTPNVEPEALAMQVLELAN